MQRESVLKNPRRVFRAVTRRIRNLLFSYRSPKGPVNSLSPYTVEPVQVPVDANGVERPSGRLYSVWQQIPGGHKWWHYFPVYESILGPLRDRPIRLLEIGVYNGGSLEMWRRYLHPDSTIVGLDIDPRCASFDRPDDRVHVRIGDQADTEFLQRVVDEFGPFDVIIDDGSHICTHMVKTFDFLFLKGLISCGTYVAEDTHTNFWRGYRDQKYTFIDLCKDLIDLTHAHYVNNQSIAPFTIGGPGRLPAATLTRIGAEISELRFLDSMIVISRKKDRFLPTVEHL